MVPGVRETALSSLKVVGEVLSRFATPDALLRLFRAQNLVLSYLRSFRTLLVSHLEHPSFEGVLFCGAQGKVRSGRPPYCTRPIEYCGPGLPRWGRFFCLGPAAVDHPEFATPIRDGFGRVRGGNSQGRFD
jgi:hypothetical protein